MNRDKALERAIELKEHSKECESVSFLESDSEFFDYVVSLLERTAPEVPVQEQLLKINRNIKFTQCSVIACSLFIILGLNLFLNRFNESIQGITDILNNNVSITGTILDLLQTITNIFVNF